MAGYASSELFVCFLSCGKSDEVILKYFRP